MSGGSLRLAVALNGYGLEHAEPIGRWRDVLSWREVASLARSSEELGYEAVFAPEIGGWEAFTLLTGIAMETDRIGLVSGVIPLSSRGLEHLAMGAASLQELCGGRFKLGVGSRETIERTKGKISALKELLATGRGYEYVPGEDREVDWRTDWRRPVATPLFLAALGPRMTALAGAHADGVILNWCTPERVAEARESIPAREGFTVAVYVRACLWPNRDEAAAEALRIAASRYGAMAPYGRQFEQMGVDPSDADAVVAATCIRGGRDEALARLGEYADAGADVVVVYPLSAGEAVSTINGTMATIAPSPAS